MQPDPNKKKEQKPNIKINKINIPSNIRNLLNPSQGQGRASGASGAGAAAIGPISTMDPFIKIGADSNRGIILMPVLSDVKLTLPSGSLESFATISPLTASTPSAPSTPLVPQAPPVQSPAPPFASSSTPVVGFEKQPSLSFPSFSSLSRKSSSGYQPAPAGQTHYDFNISEPSLSSRQKEFESDPYSYFENIPQLSITPREQLTPVDIKKLSSYNLAKLSSSPHDSTLSSIASQQNLQNYPISISSESILGAPSSSSGATYNARLGSTPPSTPPSSSSSSSSSSTTSTSSTVTEPPSSTTSTSSRVTEPPSSTTSTSSRVPEPPSSTTSTSTSVKQDTPRSVRSDRYSEKGMKELEFQEDLQERFAANISPQERERQKEFIFNPDLSRKSKRQQNNFLNEKGKAEALSIEHFNREFSKLKTDKSDDEGNFPPPPPEEEEELYTQTDETAYNFLYPTLDDPQFNIKIASKKEFSDTKYDGTVYDSLEKIKKHSDKMCNADFELSPHQLFVRNFLSFQTPYNSLLLYHGLGTGKTCSAITICEEMRDYLTQIGLSTSKKIIIVASPNVQENFKLQLFDKNKLKLIDGIWNIRSCTGNKFLKEINPMNMKGMEQDKVVSEIKKIIRSSYRFLGYDQFANLIEKTSKISDDITDKSHKTKLMMQKLKLVFGNSLIVIDEFHNIKSTDEKSGTRAVADQLEKLVRFGPFLMMRLLLLTGTPMYNSYREIIWLLNIMRINDGRAEIDIRDVFNSNPDEGIFVETNEGEGRGQITETGKENLRRFSTGYISYIRGENPYTFPFRIYPDEFAPDHTFSGVRTDVADPASLSSIKEGDAAAAGENEKLIYQIPTIQINGKEIPEFRALSRMRDKIYLTNASEYQQNVYSYIIRQFISQKREEMRNIEESISVGINILRSPIEALNISYPSDDFNPSSDNLSYDIRLLVGKFGLRNIMNYNESTKTNFEYKEDKPHIFSRELIGQYSSKIKNICDNIYKSEGIILIYSFYIEGGVIPMALALESMGFTRYGTKARSLFNVPPDGVRNIDGITSRDRSEMKANETFFPAKYVIISGEAALSPDNIGDVKAASNEANFDGRFVKVIIISKSGTEGLDFKNIRQTHILEPWYNINLIEQTIGRAVRNCSHKDLEFEKRNVQIFLHGSILSATPTQEAADIYMYRLSERKARYIGEVSRVLKENAVDCILNIEQTNFTEENFDEKLNDEPVTQILSSYDPEKNTPTIISYKIGDKNYSTVCDYMECVFSCKPGMSENQIGMRKDIFTDSIITMNTDKIIQRIRDIFQEKYLYKRNTSGEKIKDISSDLISTINYNKKYPIEAIDIALTQLLEDKNEFLRDKYGRYGRLVNIGSYYFFQPLELDNPIIPLRDRRKPIDFKREKIIFRPNKEKNYFDEFKKSYISSLHNPRASTVTGMRQLSALEEAEKNEEEENAESEDELTKYFSKTSRKIPKSFIKVKKLFESAIDEKRENKYKRGNNDWYYNCGNILRTKLAFIPTDVLETLVVRHILEELNIEETLEILNYMISPKTKVEMQYRRDNPNEYKFETLMEDYYESNILHSRNGMEAILLINIDGTYQLFLKDSNINIWKPSGPSDIEYFTKEISEKNAITRERQLNNYIGFITSVDSRKKDFSSLVFKTKKISSSSGKGKGKSFASSIASRCDQAGRATVEKNIKNILQPPIINEIIDAFPHEIKESYLNYEIEKRIDENGKIIPIPDDIMIQIYLNRIPLDNSKQLSASNKRDMNEIELCILQEFILRYFDYIEKNEKRWFLTPIQVLLNKIEKLK
jgi:hypothetical protein